MFLTKPANLFFNALLTVVYPQTCALCGQSVEDRKYGPCCLDCWTKTRIFADNEVLCWKCGELAPSNASGVDPRQVRCHRCDLKLFDNARACGIYEGALREAVLLLKGQPIVSEKVRELLLTAARRPPLREGTRLVPVPLHPERQSRRGFNQAKLLARLIGPQLRMVVDDISLVRTIASHKYRAGLDARGREQTVARAFEVRYPKLVQGESILLIDDVLTTGATASSCAFALKEAGANSVQVLTLARPNSTNY